MRKVDAVYKHTYTVEIEASHYIILFNSISASTASINETEIKLKK